MLVGVTALWGLAFPVMKHYLTVAGECPSGELASSTTLIGLRMILALFLLVILRPRQIAAATRRENAAGAFLGLVFFLGFALQVAGLNATTPARSAFITGVSSALVPIVAWILFRSLASRLTLVGLGLGVLGTGILGISNGSSWDWNRGDALTLAGSVFFAFQIVFLDRLGKRLNSSQMTSAFFAVTGLAAIIVALAVAASGPGIYPWLQWIKAALLDPALALDLALQSVFSTFLAFLWMNTYQPRVPAGRAALVYLLEPVFASAFSIFLGFDTLALALVAGGGLILIGNLLAELPRSNGTLKLPPTSQGAGGDTMVPTSAPGR
jgi:drug/metabolite transporter (DMT)-like permease